MNEYFGFKSLRQSDKSNRGEFRCSFAPQPLASIVTAARAHGMWTYEPRQGRNAATVVCSAFAVVTLVFPFSPSPRPFRFGFRDDGCCVLNGHLHLKRRSSLRRCMARIPHADAEEYGL